MTMNFPKSAHPSAILSKYSFYFCIRKLHLYLGLFISPFVLLFAVSTIALNHNWGLGEEPDNNGNMHRLVRQVELPAESGNLDKAQDILRQLGVAGEIGFINHLPREGRLVFTVMKPGREISVDVNLQTGNASIEQQATNFWKRLVYLHKSPGPHNANIRGNWIYTRLWKILADSVVYLLIFLTAGGVYLWTVIRAERKPGLVCLGLGMVCFTFMVFALSV
jgi:hypothetical protein